MIASLCLTGCASYLEGKFAIQAGRVVQMESYYVEHHLRDKDTAERVLGVFLGGNNVCALPQGAWENYVKLAATESFETLGNLSLSFSAYPFTPNSTFLEGVGSYMIRKKDSGELVATADFHIIDDGPHVIGHGDQAIELRIAQTVVRQIYQECTGYMERSELLIRAYVTEVSPGIVQLAPGPHELGLRVSPVIPQTISKKGNVVSDDGTERSLIQVWPVGCVNFVDANDGRKLIDLRDMNTYLKKYPGGGEQSASAPDIKRVTWLDDLRCDSPIELRLPAEKRAKVSYGIEQFKQVTQLRHCENKRDECNKPR